MSFADILIAEVRRFLTYAKHFLDDVFELPFRVLPACDLGLDEAQDRRGLIIIREGLLEVSFHVFGDSDLDLTHRISRVARDILSAQITFIS
jgi:hypothetical protein